MNRFHIEGKYEYCPNGNHWTDMSGIFDKKLYLYCDCNKCNGEVYVLRPVKVTKKISSSAIERHKNFIKLEEVIEKINFTNMNKIEELLSN